MCSLCTGEKLALSLGHAIKIRALDFLWSVDFSSCDCWRHITMTLANWSSLWISVGSSMWGSVQNWLSKCLSDHCRVRWPWQTWYRVVSPIFLQFENWWKIGETISPIFLQFSCAAAPAPRTTVGQCSAHCAETTVKLGSFKKWRQWQTAAN